MKPAASSAASRSNIPMAASSSPVRPHLVIQSQSYTRYMEMLLDLDKIPRLHNICASFFTWLLLAGYVVFPATFTTVNKDNKITQAAQTELERQILNGVRNAPLLYVAAVCCIVGSSGMIWLWFKWRSNYVWMINRIFLPGLLNSVAGLISTLVNIYSAQNGDFSITAKVTVIATGVCAAITALLFLLYNNWALSRVKETHQKAMDGELIKV
ncbi:hypothetical protein MMC32_000515 [Xylographa parallela]|nr:hypothetical protein [Xylographa parallela]